ncbi:MAG: phage major capsid protein [Lacrimispora saccharolytica]
MNRTEYLEKRQSLYAEAEQLIEAGNLDEANAKMQAITDLDTQFENESKAAANLRAMSQVPAPLKGIGEGEKFGTATNAEEEDIYNSIEYRRAFMNLMINGTPLPEKFRNEAGPSKTTDVSAAISPVVVKRIVDKMQVLGNVLPLVTHTAFPAGAVVPVSSIKAVASWVAEGATSEKQKLKLTQIDIKGYKLRCAVSMTLEASVMTLDVFETYFVDSVSKAMVWAQEEAFFNGTGSGQPKGILKETVVDSQNVDIAAAEEPTYQTLTEAEGLLPAAYEANAVWNMTKKTFMKFMGMVDKDGQPVARINYGLGGAPERYLLGRRVVINEHMTSLGASLSGDTVVAFLFDWLDYMYNTNYAMRVKQYEDDDTEDQIAKAVMVSDGKAIDLHSLVTVTKKNA